jgi:hypothetical protein
MITRQEWATLRRPAAMLGAALMLSLVAVGLSGWFRKEGADKLERASVVRDTAFQRLRSVEQQQRDIATFQAPFLALQERGLVGSESRLAWIETIQSAQQYRRLPSASYEIEPQQMVSAPMRLAGYQLRASRMQLHLGLLHELDLFHFMDDLRTAGAYTTEDCRIKRVPVPAPTAAAPRLLADCTLVWVTLDGGRP